MAAITTKLDDIYTCVKTKIQEYDALNAKSRCYSTPGKHEAYVSIMLGIDRYILQKQLDTGNSEYDEKHKKIMMRGEAIIKEYEAMRCSAFLAVPQ